MRHDERAALGSTANDAVRDVVDTVQGMHKAIADTSFGAAGGGVPKVLHDAISAGVYASIRAASGPVTGLLARALRTSDTAIADTPKGAYALAALDAWAGDRLAEQGSPLAVPMAVRSRGRVVGTERAALAAAFPEATGTVVVFLHGLGETEHAWGYQPKRAEGEPPLPPYSQVVEAAGATTVQLRFNSGEHISDNGLRLDLLLSELVDNWPVPVTRLVLVGHSMGGLIIRSSCHQARDHDSTWVALVTDTVSLGSPHHGAGMERWANLGTTLLGVTPWSRPLERLANTRSVGIKDLRYGNLLADDWAEADPDELWVDRATDVPLLETARHHMVAASLADSPESRSAKVVGDLLVVPQSAHGQRRTARRTQFILDNPTHIGGASHFSLLNHPVVSKIIDGVMRREV